MRRELIIGLLILLLASCVQPPAEVPKATYSSETTHRTGHDVDSIPIDVEGSTFEFEGYGPGKSHKGTFTQIKGSLQVENGTIIGAQGTIIPASVDTGISGLNRHLKSEDFFDVDRCPDITFTGTISDRTMIGLLKFHCIEHEICSPVKRTQKSLQSDFLLDITPFKLKYLGINDNVRITFDARI